MQSLPPEGRIVALVGQSGSGKSTLARQLVESRARVIVCEQTDAKSEYQNTVRFVNMRAMVAAFRDLGPRAHTIPFRVAISPGTSQFPALLAFAWLLGDVTVVIEEFGKYYGQGLTYNTPEGRSPVPRELVHLCERGRHGGPTALAPVSLVAIAQRAMRLPTVVRAECTRLYAFRQALEHDRKYLADFPGSSGEIAEQTKDLPKFAYLNIDSEGGCSREITRP